LKNLQPGSIPRALRGSRYDFLLALDDATRPLIEAEEITLRAAEHLGKYLGVNRCAYCDVEADQDTFNLTGNYNDGVPSIVGRYTFQQFGSECLRLLRKGTPFVVDDSETDPRTAEARDAYRMTEMRSVICVPLLKAGKFVAAMAVNQKRPRNWEREDIELLQLVASRCWESIERARVTRELRDTRDRLQAALIAGNVATWVWNVETGVVCGDRNMGRMFGRDEETVAITEEEYAQVVHPEDRAAQREALQRALTSADQAYEAEYRIALPDGTIRSVLARGRIERDASGRVVRVPGVLLDVTDRKRAEDELRAADRRKDEILAMLAHELRNPLAPIRNAAQILKMLDEAGPLVRQTSEIIARQIEHMTGLVDDLLDVSRVTRGLITLEHDVIDLRNVIDAAVEQARALIDTRKHRFSSHVGAQPLIVCGDRKRLTQVIANLLTNAAKYTHDGGTITLRAKLSAERVEVSVTDTGIGIAPDLIEHIFELFTQGHRSPDRSQGGLGLGLALVKNLVALHQGTIKAESEGVGKGSTFSLSIPRYDGIAVQDERRAETGSANSHSDGLRVLLVDDNADAAQTLAYILTSEGHNVTTAYEARTALARALDFRPEVAILDIGLPDIDGYELAGQIRDALGPTPITFVALTGYGQAEDRSRSKEAGFDHHLVKPIEPKQLVRLLQGFMER
jgi:PAS domain S-box-containing protein